MRSDRAGTAAQADQLIARINGAQDSGSGGHLVDAVAALNPDVTAWRLDHLGHYRQTEGAGDALAAYVEFRSRL